MTIAFVLSLAAAAAGPCALEGWSIDGDPAGLRVRSGPALSAPVIGRLPPAFPGDDKRDSFAPAFEIIDARDGWVRIANAHDRERPAGPRPIFQGRGWVHGSRVAFNIQASTGRTAPDVRAPAVVVSDRLMDDPGVVRRIIACSGGWARLRYALPADALVAGDREGEAWFGAICGNQRTTCDGVSEDRAISARPPPPRRAPPLS